MQKIIILAACIIGVIIVALVSPKGEVSLSAGQTTIASMTASVVASATSVPVASGVATTTVLYQEASGTIASQ